MARTCAAMTSACSAARAFVRRCISVRWRVSVASFSMATATAAASVAGTKYAALPTARGRSECGEDDGQPLRPPRPASPNALTARRHEDRLGGEPRARCPSLSLPSADGVALDAARWGLSRARTTSARSVQPLYPVPRFCLHPKRRPAVNANGVSGIATPFSGNGSRTQGLRPL